MNLLHPDSHFRLPSRFRAVIRMIRPPRKRFGCSGADRVATYRPLLENPDCPIAVGDIEWLFYEPYYQLMRQTLLAWQMVEHGEFGAKDWLHIHVIPARNLALRQSQAAPRLVGASIAEKWRSVLKEPERYRLVTPSELLDGVADAGRWLDWRQWLADRYMT